jgi:hypothetical protein
MPTLKDIDGRGEDRNRPRAGFGENPVAASPARGVLSRAFPVKHGSLFA